MLEVLLSNDQEGSRRERKKKEYRNKIIIAAINLFSSKGFEAASIAEIMRTADLGVGTFYNYFSSKDDIIVYLFQELNNGLEETVLKSLDRIQSPAVQVTMIYEVLARELAKNKTLSKVVYLELLRHPMLFDIISRQQLWLENLLENILSRGREENYFRQDISSEKTVRLLLGTANQGVYSWLNNETEEATLTSILSYDLDIILRGIKNNM